MNSQKSKDTASISWIHPSIEVRKAGDKGIGSFANKLIKKDEVVVIQGGRIIPASTLEEEAYAPYAYHCFQIEKDFYIAPISLEEEFIDGIFKVNHSCDPTCGMKGQITLVSMRDIHPGDEITFDYAMCDMEPEEEVWESMHCLCNSEKCRGEVTGRDWELPELRSRYNGYFSRYISEFINKRVA